MANIKMERIKKPISDSRCFGLFIAIIVLSSCSAYETYFPVSDVHLTIPQHPTALKQLRGVALLKVRAETLHPQLNLHQQKTQNNQTTTAKSVYRYGIYNKYGFLSIDEHSGKIWADVGIGNLEHSVSFIVEAIPITGNTAKMTLTLMPKPVSSLFEYCAAIENICFWATASYKISETNANATQTVGSLGPDFNAVLCPGYDVKYTLLNATEFLDIHSGVMYTRKRIDHDSFLPGPSLWATVRCEVWQRDNKVVQETQQVLKVTILDRNDNVPELHADMRNVTVELDTPYFNKDTEIGHGILFSDSDSLAQNTNIVYEIMNDFTDLLVPKCQAFEADHLGLKASAINCKLFFARTGVLRQSPYCVTLTASDPSAEAAATHVTAAAVVCLRSDLSKIHETDRPAAQALQSGLENASRRKNRKNRKYVDSSEEASTSDESSQSGDSSAKIYYPHKVTVSRKASVMWRVVQPVNMKDLIKDKGPAFRIDEDLTKAFDITESGGIVFVRNVTALQTAPETLYYVLVKWLKSTASIIVRLDDLHPANVSVMCEHTENGNFPMACAEMASKKECLKTCGLATNGGGCEWRQNDKPGLTTNYSTCSSSLITCPDGVCDPFEAYAQKSDHFVCPQDCAMPTNIFGPHTNDGQLGIRSATGLCTCDDFGKCACGAHDPVPAAKTKKALKQSTLAPKQQGPIASPVPVEQPPMHTAKCGPSCLAFIVVFPIVLIVFIVGVVVSRRRYQRSGTKKQMTKHNGAGLVGASGDDHIETETIALTEVPLSIMNTEFTFNSNGGDPKWEFPRSQLVLDTVLGEGEFGRVVKGYATDILGTIGVTTVAVKMLKTGANSVELLALLSEFQLLQEVKHPNVIKLLGACTQELPLVIIEYAKHGSLRNYLRLSRKLECNEIEFTNGVEPVTVKEILSFAWQICKGMAYLTEIKLVHRDLAARNVLLTEGKVCKVSDFGLTRDVYEDDAYLKRSKDRVPVKWMAPESLADHVYTTRSDVWAFGVLAWELITLGASPYPGVSPQNLYHLLKTGYRMECPENCSDEIYNIVKTCWADDPHARPPFKHIAAQWERLLGNNARYIELENTAFSNPLYCNNSLTTTVTTSIADTVSDVSASTLELEQQLDRLDHLWHPPRTSDHGIHTPEQSGPAHVPAGYDVPRPLIETKTVEQNLRYENDLRATPMNVRNLAGAAPYEVPSSICRRTSETSRLVDNGHYDTPVKHRVKSYLDMTRAPRNGSIGYNLDVQNVDKKNISKDIQFRFSSLLNLSESATTPL